MVYSREIRGKTYTFGVSGMLLKNALIMFDYETRSLWPTMMNRSVRGKMAGALLEVLPVTRKTTWGEWRKTHPEAKVLSVDGVEYKPINLYEERFAKGIAGVHPIENKDDRLGPLERVMGLDLDGATRAYPVERITGAGVIQEKVGEVDLVLAAGEETGAFGAFERVLDGESLSFSDELKEGRLLDDGGTLWDLATGLAVEGPRKGRRLNPLPVRDVFWFVWADYHPTTTLFE